MYQQTGSSLNKLMVCDLLNTEPLSKPMMTCCQLDSLEHTSVKFETVIYFQKLSIENVIWKMMAILYRPQCINVVINMES